MNYVQSQSVRAPVFCATHACDPTPSTQYAFAAGEETPS